MYQYNGKEKQDELDLDWFDYGSRMYMPEIGKWNAIDPMAEKYSPLSPYNYVANNPINAYDPNGEEIVIVGDGKYIMATLNAILQLGRTKAGAKMIDRLASSKNRVIISNGAKNSAKDGEDQNGVKSSYVTWNPNISESEGKKRPSYIGLGHELRHSDQYFLGMQDEEIIDANNPFLSSDLGAEANTLNSREIEAVHFENEVRTGMGVEPRRTYDGFDADVSNDKKTFQSGYNVATGKYTVPNTRRYKGERNAQYVVFWARVLNNFKKGPSDLSGHSKKDPYRKSGVDPGYDYSKQKNSAVIQY
jgi:RHS repeat-associated protein